MIQPTDLDLLFHALNDGECPDWFARAHDPREKLLRELADGDSCGPNFFHGQPANSYRERNNG
jgi:hypothetical protein